MRVTDDDEEVAADDDDEVEGGGEIPSNNPSPASLLRGLTGALFRRGALGVRGKSCDTCLSSRERGLASWG